MPNFIATASGYPFDVTKKSCSIPSLSSDIDPSIRVWFEGYPIATDAEHVNA
jgi:hypothetical protein